MVSEDSQDFAGSSEVHRFDDLTDLDQPIDRKVSVETHQFDDSCELLEVLPLRSSQRVLLEERDDDVPQVSDPLDAISKEVLSMIVVPAVPENLAASEESDELLKYIPT